MSHELPTTALPYPHRATLLLAVGVVAIARVVARDGVNHGSGALSNLRGLGPRARADARVAVRRISAARALFGSPGASILRARERAGQATTQLVAGAPLFAAVAADPASRRLISGAEGASWRHSSLKRLAGALFDRRPGLFGEA